MNKGQGGKLAAALLIGSAIAALVALQISSAGRIARAAALTTPYFGPAVTVYSDSVDNGEPVVAYSSVHDEYLVVWEDYNAGEIAIYGRLVNSDGQLVSGRISIAYYSTYTNTQPAVAYSPVLDQYLVVYTADSKPAGPPPNHDYDLIGRVVRGDGTLGDALLVNAVTNEQTWHPSVAYNSQDDEFLVAWEIEHGLYGAAGLRTDIYARRIYSDTGTGSWVLTPLRCVATGDPGTSDGRNRVQPDVAYNSTENEYLIAYTREGSPDYDVLGKVAPASLDGVFGSSEITICAQTYDQSQIAVAAGPDEYLAVWQNKDSSGDWDVYGRRLRGSDGLPLGAAGGFVINHFSLADSLVPEVAYGPVYGFMVAFQTDDGGSWEDDVYANYVRVGQEAPVDLPFFIDGGMSSSQREPDVVCSPGGDCLFVEADDSSGDYEIDATFLLAHRVYLPLVLRNQ